MTGKSPETCDGGKLVTITKEAHDRLLRAEAELAALEAGGVDNWHGYHWSLKEAGLLEDDE